MKKVIILCYICCFIFVNYIIYDINHTNIPMYSKLNTKLCYFVPGFKINIDEFTDNILNEMNAQKTQLKSLGIFKLTAYDDCYECQEEFIGTTALGVKPQSSHTIAVDPSIIPLGSHIIIDDIEYVAEDVGGSVKGYHIDIFVNNHSETYLPNFNKYAEVFIKE